ncbi:MAG: hypothetical protein IKU73_02165 [Clostridia bacterium]|nr:hypothetical protein [Clostridia bacterium]
MTYESYRMLMEKTVSDLKIAYDLQAFRAGMASLETVDPSGYAALAAAVGAPELGDIEMQCEDVMLSDEQREKNQALAEKLAQRLVEQGMQPHAALWSVHCWFNALSWPFCAMEHGYDETVEELTDAELEELAALEDGYAAAELAKRCEASGDCGKAAKWRKTALDCCHLPTMRWMEYTAAESQVAFKGWDELLARHASLGDPEGMAAYALHLMQADAEENREKAIRLANVSIELDSIAGQFAMYECLREMEHAGHDVKAIAKECLDVAADEGHPQACLARAISRDAKGEYAEAYADLQRSVKNTQLYPATWDGAYLLARYCLEGKGGAARNAQQAYEWAQRGAQHGSAAALGMQGAMEMQGIGTVKNPDAGALRIAEAAQAGDADSIQRMILMVRRGVLPDMNEYIAAQYADRVVVERKESADGLGFAWIADLTEFMPPQPDPEIDWNQPWEMPAQLVQEEMTQEVAEQAKPEALLPQDEEEEEEDDYLLPEELERLKAQEEEEALQQALTQPQELPQEPIEFVQHEPEAFEPEAPVQPEPEAYEPEAPVQIEPETFEPEKPVQPKWEATAFHPVEMDRPNAPSSDGTPGMLLYGINHVWDQMDQEMAAATGEPASDEVLVDLLLICLCGTMIAFEGDEKKRQAYHGTLDEFGWRMPDFAELGYDRAYLDKRYSVLAGQMAQLRMQHGSAGDSWEAVCAAECDVIGRIIDMLLQPSEKMAEGLADAVKWMFRDLNMELSEKQ